MFVKSALLFTGVAMGHAVRYANSTGDFACGAPEPTKEQIELHNVFHAQEKQNKLAGVIALADINVDVYLHSISATEGGLLDDVSFDNQYYSLRDSFSAHGIQLNYAGKERHVNADWAKETNGFEMDMKNNLRRGDYRSMNVYILDEMKEGIAGYCYYPTSAPQGSDAFFRDGCTLARSAVGPIATHEAGHWFGLMHTFDGDNCDGPGDYVDDTAAQSGPTPGGCPVGRDSCPNHPGLDPITNIMDYSSPDCWREFTAGQIDRIFSQWAQFRA